MKESNMSSSLVMQWISVIGPDGRTHMEARWQVVGEADTTATPHAA